MGRYLHFRQFRLYNVRFLFEMISRVVTAHSIQNDDRLALYGNFDVVNLTVFEREGEGQHLSLVAHEAHKQ